VPRGSRQKEGVGQKVALALEAGARVPRGGCSRQPFPWQQNLWRHGGPVYSRRFAESLWTFGTCFKSAGAWKKVFLNRKSSTSGSPGMAARCVDACTRIVVASASTRDGSRAGSSSISRFETCSFDLKRG